MALEFIPYFLIGVSLIFLGGYLIGHYHGCGCGCRSRGDENWW